jgi:hypothetical protein
VVSADEADRRDVVQQAFGAGLMSPSAMPGALMKENPNARVLMGDDPRLPAMPEKPTLMAVEARLDDDVVELSRHLGFECIGTLR